MRKIILLGLVLSACFSSTRATAAPRPRERFDVQVRGYFFEGFRGDADSLQIGMKKTEERLATHPDDAEALVWHGSGLVFQAGSAFRAGDLAAGQDLYTRGLAEIERARALAPDDVAVLIPRAGTYLTMTLFMPESPDRRALLQRGVEGYEEALRLQRDSFARLSSHARGQLLYGLADGYSRLGRQDEARKLYQRLVTDVPDSPLVPRASDWLSGKPRADKVTCIGCHEG